VSTGPHTDTLAGRMYTGGRQRDARDLAQQFRDRNRPGSSASQR